MKFMETNMLDRRSFVAGLAGTLAFKQDAWAQGYPVKPIHLIVTFPSGAGSDAVGRQVAERLSKRLGQPVVVENRVGAGGNIGMAYVARQVPDGYTIALASLSTAVINPLIYRSAPFKPEDFAAIGLIAHLSYILVTNPDVPAANLAQLIALGKAKPGSLTLASSGIGNAGHVGGELLKELGNFDMLHVPYQGAGPAMSALLGGHTSMMFALLSDAVPLVKAGRLRAIALPAPNRSSQLPEVPTFREQGIPDFELIAWFGLVSPVGTPGPVIQRMNTDLNAVISDPSLRKWLLESGYEPANPGTPAQFQAMMDLERARWLPVVKRAGISIP